MTAAEAADMTNAAFEVMGGILVLNHCRVVWKDKDVKGVSILSTALFTLWGMWNIYFYPSLGQWWSFWGGLVIFWANVLWVYLMLRYRHGNPEKCA